MELSKQESRSSAGNNQEAEQAGCICDMKERVNIRMVILKASKGTHFIAKKKKKMSSFRSAKLMFLAKVQN